MNEETVPFLFKQSASRSRALAGSRYESYSLFGLPELQKQGLPVTGFELGEATGLQRILAGFFRRACQISYNNGGNFQGVLPRLGALRESPAIVATSNGIGITILCLKKWRVLKVPVLVISVGLELHARRPSARRRKRLGRLLWKAERILVFTKAEKRYLIDQFGIEPKRIVARPFGIPVSALPEQVDCGGEEWDLLSVGADWMRDFPLLVDWAREHPEVSVRMVVESSRRHTLGDLPDNIMVEMDLSLEEVFDRLRRSKAVVIPVRQNPYTAGTTFLIHSLASGRPTLVARTEAIDEDYGLEDGRDCVFYKPEDRSDFHSRLSYLRELSEDQRRQMGESGARWARSRGTGSEYCEEIGNFVSQATKP